MTTTCGVSGLLKAVNWRDVSGKVATAIADTLFPPICHVCKTFIPECGPIHLCSSCTGKINFIHSPLCTKCGMPFRTENGIDHTCGACTGSSLPFASARAAAEFDGPVQDLIHRLKYGKKVHLSRPVGRLTAHYLQPPAADKEIDFLVPVPLHPKRLRERGFNQALLLAGVLSKFWEIPVSRCNLQRIRWTEPQTRLSMEDRVRNVRGAFAVHQPQLFRDRKMILVDDVYTTGSTVIECARALKRAGAGEILVVTVARAVFR